MYPPVNQTTDRVLPSDMTIGEYCLTKGVRNAVIIHSTYASTQQQLHIPIRLLQNMPQYWHKPDHFQPARFLPENEHEIMPGAYMPFGHGPRTCVGRFLAITVMTLTLAMFFQRYRAQLDAAHPIEEISLVANQPKYGVRVFISKR